MAEILLIHGAWHGAWCWEEFGPALQARGHGVHAADLPGLGGDRTPSAEVTLDAYATRIADRVRAIRGKVWLVGHSMGGIAITQAAELVADHLGGLVYVTAFMPLHGQSLIDLSAQDTETHLNGALVIDPATNTATVPPDRVKAAFYGACTDAQAERAQARLRPQALGPMTTPQNLTDGAYGRVSRYYVECLQDRALSISAQRRMHQAAGVAAVATLDTDHSPFYSKIDELAAAIDGFVRDAPA